MRGLPVIQSGAFPRDTGFAMTVRSPALYRVVEFLFFYVFLCVSH